jgi:DNA polymerase-1
VKKVVLIDGDEFIFKGCAAVEDKVKWDEKDDPVRYADPKKAWKNIRDMIARVFERFGTKEHVICFSTEPRTNFRYAVDPTYKNNRAESVKPLCYAEMREKVWQNYTCKEFHDLEADDVMGMLSTQPTKAKKIIVSQDKDMKTIPGTLWTGKDLMEISETEADYWHMYQTLVGDTSDGYPGCPGVGKVGAAEFLEKPYVWLSYEHVFKSGPRKGMTETRWKQQPTTNVWEGVVSQYAKAGLTEDDAVRQARLARILRWSDWDQEKKVPILWTPKS